jgi:predicted CopG family antitoxin
MKSIGISDDVYLELLEVKHEFEKKEGRVISYDEVIKKLITLNEQLPAKTKS